MIFYHEPINLNIEQPLSVYEEDGVRYYKYTQGTYPSVTSVLGYFKKQSLGEWRNRIGQDEATKITAQAARRGTVIHNMIENFLNNQDVGKQNIFDRALFKAMIPALKRINNIICQEQPLFSDEIKLAGRVDNIASFDNELSIIDFKTSRKPKLKEHITDYFEQATAYGIMYKEHTGIPINKIVVIIGNDEGEVQVFEEDKRKYETGLRWKIEEFRNQKGMA